MRRSEVPFQSPGANIVNTHSSETSVDAYVSARTIKTPTVAAGRSAVVEHPAQLRHAGEPLPALRPSKVEHITLPDRTWPDRVIEARPGWCAVDLRDGNQALIDPMSPARKRRMFELLVRMGYKEIEVGFRRPARPTSTSSARSSSRALSRRRHHPGADPVPRRTDRADLPGLHGAPTSSCTSTTRPRSRSGAWCSAPTGRHRRDRRPRRAAVKNRRNRPRHAVALRVLPESYTGTELVYAKEVCDAVADVLQPTPDQR